MKVNIIQFDPVVGGETTLTSALSAILRLEHEVRVIHPVETTSRGKLKINNFSRMKILEKLVKM
jgi:hypothetical protein